MRIRILGTAAAEAIPGLHCTCDVCRAAAERGGKDIRARSSVLIDDDLMIDFGPDGFLHMLRWNLQYEKLRHLFITHDHADHFAIDDIFYRSPGYAHGAPELRVYGNENVTRRMAAIHPCPQLSHERIAHGSCASFDGTRVTALRALHDRHQECLLYVVERDGKTVLHGHDTGIFPDETFEALRAFRLDAAWLDCTTGLHKEGGNHMGIEDIAIVRERLLSIGCADANTRFIATHFSHNGGLLHAQLEERLRPMGFDVAYDGMIIEP